MVEAQFVLGRLEAVLDRPAAPLDANEGFDGGAGRTPSGEEGEVTIGDVAADQQTPGPCAGRTLGIFIGFRSASSK